MWGDATSANSEAFLNGVDDPWVKDDNGNWSQDKKDTIRNDAALPGTKGDTRLRDWIKGGGDNSFADPEYFTEWCSSYITEILKSIAENYDKDNDGPIMGAVQAMGSQIQAQSSTENTNLSTQSQGCSSVVSNINQAATPATNACDAVVGTVSNGASAQQQISA